MNILVDSMGDSKSSHWSVVDIAFLFSLLSPCDCVTGFVSFFCMLHRIAKLTCI